MTPICCPLTSIYTLSHVPSPKQINIKRNQFEIASYSELHNTIIQWLALSHLRHESLLCPEHSHFMFYLIASHLMAFSVKKSTFIIPHCLCESRSLLFTNGPKHNLVKEEIHNVVQGEKVIAIYTKFEVIHGVECSVGVLSCVFPFPRIINTQSCCEYSMLIC